MNPDSFYLIYSMPYEFTSSRKGHKLKENYFILITTIAIKELDYDELFKYLWIQVAVGKINMTKKKFYSGDRRKNKLNLQ